MKLILGLGNPGKRYEKTRHNIGFVVLDMLHEAYTDSLSGWAMSTKFNAVISTGYIGEQSVVLAKPMTYMNHSGHTASVIGQYYKLHPEDIIVVHDDKDLIFGEIKVHHDRGHAGHNGIRSIIDIIGSKKFHRIRVGVAPAGKKDIRDTAKFVLQKFSFTERRKLKNELLQNTIEEVELLL